MTKRRRIPQQQQREQADPGEIARMLRAVLAEINDPEDDLRASRATVRRIEGAAVALEQLSRPAA